METCLNILIVHNKYQFAGGEDTVVAQDAALLSNHGHKVFLYERHNDELKTRSKLSKLFLPFETIYSRKTVREVRKIIRDNHIDIVHVHNTLPLVSLSVYYAAKKEHCKLFQTLHNFRFVCPGALLFRDNCICEDCLNHNLSCAIKHKCYRNSKLQTTLVSFMTWLHRKLGTFKMPDAYISLTEFQKSRMIPYLPQEKIIVKPNYLDKPTLIEDENLTQKINTYKDYYLYIGRVERVKGVFVVLDAFCTLNNKTLIILGSGPDNDQVEDFIHANHCTNIHFFGFTPHDQAMLYLANAKGIIFPSLLYEGFPMNFVEGMALGVPIIASNTANVSSILDHKKHGYLFETGDSASLIEGINWLENDSINYQKIKEYCLNTYYKKYTTEVSYQKLLDIYGSK